MGNTSSQQAASNWRESDERHFPEIYNPEPKQFPRYKYPGETKEVYALHAHTRPPRAPGHDQDLIIREDECICGIGEQCVRHLHCSEEKCLSPDSNDATGKDISCKHGKCLGNHEFKWLPSKVGERLKVLAIHDAKAYDEYILELASRLSTTHLVSEEQIADVRIWPTLHQYGHNFATTHSATASREQYQYSKGTGNIDGFGLYCCEDCYVQAYEEDRRLLMAGDEHVLESGGYYERLCDYNSRMKQCIALRKEKLACAMPPPPPHRSSPSLPPPPPPSQAQAQAQAAARPPTPQHPTPPPAPQGKEYEKGFGCRFCPNFYTDRKKGSGPTLKKSLEYHVSENHAGWTVEDVVYGREDCKLRKAKGRGTKRQRAGVKEDEAGPSKRQKTISEDEAIAAEALIALAYRVVDQTNPAAPTTSGEEVLEVIRFEDAENAFLNSGIPIRGEGRLELVHHGGVPAIRAAFRSGERRRVVEDAASYTPPTEL